MVATEPSLMPLHEAARRIRTGELSPLELTESCLRQIDRLEPEIKAWVTLDREGALRQAEVLAEDARSYRFRGVLHGIPIGIKDIYFTAGMRTTAGHQSMLQFVPSYDAAVVERLKQAGAIILGKTTTTEFALMAPTATRNPWNLDHTPGGSSSGSGAAVAARMCPAAIGSQTGGSTIRPAAYCGIVGFKPTYGRISTFGMIPGSWSLDHVGIFTKTARDACTMLEVLAGFDPLDITSLKDKVPPYSKLIGRASHRKPRLGLLRDFFYDNSNQDVKRNIDETVRTLRSKGANISVKNLPPIFDLVASANRAIMTSEIAAVHEEIYRLRKKDYGPKIRGR